MSAPRFVAPAAVLLAAYAVVLVVLAAKTPWTVDEPNYLYAGLALRARFEFDAFNTILHGPLTFYGNQLFMPDLTEVTPAALIDLKLRTRLGAIPFALLAAAFTALIGKDAFGSRAGLIALALFVVNPLLLGHGCLITADMPLTAGFMATLWAAMRYLQRPAPRRVAAVGIALGLTLATKYLALFLLPVLGIAFTTAAARGWQPWPRRRERTPSDGDGSPRRGLGRAARRLAGLLPAAAVVGACAWAALHACYLGEAGFYRIRQPEPVATAVDPRDPDAGPLSDTFRALVRNPVTATLLRTLPAPFVRGVDYQKLYSERAGQTYFAGRFGPGFPSYVITALLLKLPLSALFLVLLGGVMRTPRWPQHAAALFAAAIAVPIAYLSLGTTLQIGVRYALPVVPLLLVIAARGGITLLRSNVGRVALVALGGWLALTVALAWPRYIGWCNAVAADRPYRFFADSNVDWQHRGWSTDEDAATIAARYADSTLVVAASGPRFGVLRANALELAPPDPDDPTRAYHWLWRFPPIDRLGPWFVFRVDEESYRRTIPDGDERGRAELATALVAADRIDAALAVLASTAGASAARVRAAALRIAATRPDDPSTATTWLELGQFQRVLALGDAAPPLPRATAAFLGKDFVRAADLLAGAEQRRELAPAELLLLASALERQGHLDEALSALRRHPRPDSEPLRTEYDRLVRELSDQAEDLGLALRRARGQD